MTPKPSTNKCFKCGTEKDLVESYGAYLCKKHAKDFWGGILNENS